MPEKLFLIDGSNHAFRVQFALPPQHASDGFPTRVLYGFTLLFQKMMRTYRPDYVAVSFDSGKTFRHELYSEYKGHRPDMPEDLLRQWPLLPELVEGFGYATVALEGYEADDVLGTLAAQFASPDLQVFLVSGDKDLCQLIGPHVSLVDDTKGKIMGPDGVVDAVGVAAEQVVDMKGLAGDSSDNIPGIPGIGPKTAAKLLKDHGSLEAVLEAAAAGKIKGKRGQNLVAHADDARISKKLARIRTDLELGVTLEDMRPRGVQEEPLRELFDRWEFGMVARKLLPQRQVVDPSMYKAVADHEQLDEVLAAARAAERVFIDVRTAGKDPQKAVWIGLGLAFADRAVYVPLELHPGHTLEPERARQQVLELLSDPAVEKLGHGLKAALRTVRRAGGDLSPVGGDTLLLDYVLVAHRRSHGIADIAQRHLGHNLAFVPDTDPMMLDDVARYAAEPAHVASLLFERLDKRLEPGTRHVYEHIERPLTRVLADMEEVGIRLDLEALDAVLQDIAGRVQLAKERCHELAGRAFVVGSPKDVAAVLFDELGLPKSKRTKTGYSTDSSVLERLTEHHDLPAAILEYRQLQKLESTYLRKLPGFVGPDGRIHTTFHQAVAATGRLSSSDPNLQNIPVRTFEGRRIRDCFVPADGCVFLSADYSQVELRVLAHFCGSGALVDSFRRGEDIHRRTASEVWHVPMEEVSPDQRTAAKAINFGLLYGMSAFRLGRDLAISRDEAQRYMDEYFARIPQVSAWIEETKQQARKDGYVETLFGRRRLIPELYAKNYNDRSAGEREAVNTRVQGTAADLIKLAMLRVDSALREAGHRARLLLQVHDELLLEVPDDEVLLVQAMVVRQMQAAAELLVPLAVNSTIGRNWNEAHG